MDIIEKVNLIEKSPTEEIVTREELVKLFEINSSPNHYIGLEISGFLHLGSLISTGFKINDFIKAGVNCTIFLADWHTIINDKLGGNWDTISQSFKVLSRCFQISLSRCKNCFRFRIYIKKIQSIGQILLNLQNICH